MKNLTVLGSTGSIGRQTLEVVAGNPEHLHIKVLAAHKNASLMLKQIQQFKPELAVLTDPAAALELQRADHDRTEILSGEEGLLAAATYAGVDTVLAAMVGYAGLKPTLTAIEHGKNIALANKETLVAAGSLVMEAVRRHQVSLTPVDSEHSAIFQSLRAGKKDEVRRLIITASGGPFRGMSKAELAHVTLEQCLHHPNWSMGKKVTIDSSTLANKGLEVMEAHWLFDMPYDKIDVVIHPQSIVHSLVEYVDGAVIAQLGIPDMRLPIQYALSYPQRFNCHFGSLDLVKYGTLTFEKPDVEVFPLLQVAITCGREGGTLPCAFNAANEECVNAFLAGRIKYLDIPELVKKTVAAHKQVSHPTLEDIAAADKVTREAARRYLTDI
jgi:1-deoxy-D-xylulose-5-phosphate reductoisomerase